MALFLLGISYGAAQAQIVLDGNIVESDWNLLGTSQGGPAPSFGAGHEINGLSAKVDNNALYIAMAGNVQVNNRILVFIDSLPGGYTNGNFGRNGAPPGISGFNQTSQFDDGFSPNYVLIIGAETGEYSWNLYTLSGSFGFGGGPNLFLGNRTDADLGGNPANSDLTRGFEARLTYSSSGAGVDIAVNQAEIRMMAAYSADNGVLSNQFISRANPGDGSFGGGQVLFNAAAPGPVIFASTLVINEVDYIQPGPDNAEFIEIKNITSLSLNLDAFRLRFARGGATPPDVYREIDLPNINVAAGGYFVVCTNPATVPNCTFVVEPPTDLLENALPAAVGLFNNNVVVDAVSYGGNTGAPYTEGTGAPADAGTDAGLGLARVVDGVDTNRNNVDFGLRCVTPGQPNSGQSTNCSNETPTPTLTPTPTNMTATPTPTGTTTPTSTPTPTGSVTPTGSPTPTGTIVPIPPGCSNILISGDFEANAAWEFGNSPIPGKYTSIPARAGLRSVQLGNPPESNNPQVYSYSSVRQLVMVPHSATTVQLRWWHFYRTEQPTFDSPNQYQDRQEVILLKPNGDTLRILQRVRRNDGVWQQSALDLSEFAGRNFFVYFNVYNTGVGGRTWNFIDDVELLVCGQQIAIPYNTYSTAMPQVYPTAILQVYPTAIPAVYPTANPATACNPYYPTLCLPFYAANLNCEDIPYVDFAVLPPDPYDLDADNDGIGCESTAWSSSPNSMETASATPTATSTPIAPPTVTPTNTPNPVPTETPTQTPTTQAQIIPHATHQPSMAAAPAGVQEIRTHVQAASPTPENCTELIVDGSFDTPGVGWNSGTSVILPSYTTLFTGNPGGQTLLLGIVDPPNRFGISAVQQRLHLPADADTIRLSFRYFPRHDTTAGAGDFQSVDLYDATTGELLRRILGVQQNDRMWLDQTYDLTTLAGQSIQLFFVVSNDGAMGTIAMYIDDISVLACQRTPAPQQPQLAAAPTTQLLVAETGTRPRPVAGSPIPTQSPTPTPITITTLASAASPWLPVGNFGMILTLLGIAGVMSLIIPYIRRTS